MIEKMFSKGRKKMCSNTGTNCTVSGGIFAGIPIGRLKAAGFTVKTNIPKKTHLCR